MGIKGGQNKDEERRPVTSLGGKPGTDSSLMVLAVVVQALSRV